MPPIQSPSRQGPLFDPLPAVRLRKSARRAAKAALAELIAAVLRPAGERRPGGSHDDTR